MQIQLVILVLVALIACRPSQTEARSSTPEPSQTNEPATQLDEPANSATSESAENDDDGTLDDICVRCYDKVKVAQDLVDIYDGLLRKQKKLIQRKKAAAEAAETRPAKPSSSVRSRTLASSTTGSVTNEPIVVSRLRVARSPGAGAVEQSRASATNKEQQKYAGALNKKDLELERLKREQQRQKDTTCKALLDVRDCLDLLARECIGNLQFHSYEVFSDQWHGKLRCPYPNNPNLKPLPGLLPRSIADSDSKVPIPRPISSDDEVRQRLQKILPDRQFPRPLGVMLKPTVPFASQRQELAEQSQPQQQFKGPYQSLMRDFSHFGAGLAPLSPTAGVATQQRQLADDQLNMVNVGKLLLVPCCFAIMVALVALASLRYHHENAGDEEEAGHAAYKN